MTEKTQAEIISRIDFLKGAVKTRGRKYSKAQRVEMREEIGFLENELNEKIVKEFEEKYQDELETEVQVISKKVNSLLGDLDEGLIRFILEPKIDRLNIKVNSFLGYQQNISNLRKMRFEKFGIRYRAVNGVPPNSKNTALFGTSNLGKLQRYIASYYKKIRNTLVDLVSIHEEIQKIYTFLCSDDTLNGFVYLSDALFKEASNFEKGYSIIKIDEVQRYFSYLGKYHELSTPEHEIPIIKKDKSSPDLQPFSDYKGNEKLEGYENRKGQIIIPATFKKAFPFKNGFAKVALLKDGWKTFTYGLINSKGRIVLPCEFAEIGEVYNDVVRYKRHVYREGYVRTNPASGFDMRHAVWNEGFLNGFVIFGEIKSAITQAYKELMQIYAEMPEFLNQEKRQEVKKSTEYYKKIIEHSLKLL